MDKLVGSAAGLAGGGPSPFLAPVSDKTLRDLPIKASQLVTSRVLILLQFSRFSRLSRARRGPAQFRQAFQTFGGIG